MAQTAANLVVHVILRVPVRQCVTSLPIPLRLLLAAAGTCRVAFGLRAGQKVFTLRGARPRDADRALMLCAEHQGFSLSGTVRCGTDGRLRLEQDGSSWAHC